VVAVGEGPRAAQAVRNTPSKIKIKKRRGVWGFIIVYPFLEEKNREQEDEEVSFVLAPR
jgi:hypothetical protein